MTGYNKGFKLRINGEIVTLWENDIRNIGHYDTVCRTQEKILKDFPDEFDDDVSFNLAECAVSVLDYDDVNTIDDAIKRAITDGFFPTKDGKVKAITDSKYVG